MKASNLKHIAISVALAAAAAMSWGADYTWNGSMPAGLWTNRANWQPSDGYPQQTEDRALFGAPSSAGCGLNQTVSIGELTLAPEYNGILTLGPSGNLSATTITLQGGAIATGDRKLTATQGLIVTGGLVPDVTCEGDAYTSGGTIGSLRMRGADSVLTAAPLPGQAVARLEIESGRTTLQKMLRLERLAIAPGTTLSLGRLSTLVFPASGEVPAGGILDVTGFGCTVLCNGDWSCQGRYHTARTLSNALTIVQSVLGSVIDHGDNEADLVVVANGEGKVSTWTSSNNIAALTVLPNSALNVAGRLSVEGPIANAGKIAETAPGYIHHDASRLEAVNEARFPVTAIGAGQDFRVRLRDADETLDFSARDTASGIVVKNLRNGDSVAVDALETSASSTFFLTAPIQTQTADAAAADSVLQVLAGDTLQVAYTDNEDPSDNQSSLTLAIGTEAPLDLAATKLVVRQIRRKTRTGLKTILRGTMTVANSGTQRADFFAARFFLSDDDQLDTATDFMLSERMVPSLRQNRRKQVPLKVIVPPETSVSGAYVIGIADADDRIAETTEQNNVIVFGPLP